MQFNHSLLITATYFPPQMKLYNRNFPVGERIEYMVTFEVDHSNVALN